MCHSVLPTLFCRSHGALPDLTNFKDHLSFIDRGKNRFL
jgi:hypothetical protein